MLIKKLVLGRRKDEGKISGRTITIFLNMPVIQESHKDLFKDIKLIVETSNKHKELEELNKELTELNK